MSDAQPAPLASCMTRRSGHVVDVATDPKIEPARLRIIVAALLEALGLRILDTRRLGDGEATRICTGGAGALLATRIIVYVEPSPEGNIVAASTLRALLQDVAHDDATLGVVMTPHRIDRTDVAASDLVLIDGPALSGLLDEHVPELAIELGGYRPTRSSPPSWRRWLAKWIRRHTPAREGS